MFPGYFVRDPSSDNTADERSSTVRAIEGTENVCGVSIARFALRCKIEIGVEVRLTGGTSDNCKTIGCGERADRYKDNDEQIESIEAKARRSPHLGSCG